MYWISVKETSNHVGLVRSALLELYLCLLKVIELRWVKFLHPSPWRAIKEFSYTNLYLARNFTANFKVLWSMTPNVSSVVVKSIYLFSSRALNKHCPPPCNLRERRQATLLVITWEFKDITIHNLKFVDLN